MRSVSTSLLLAVCVLVASAGATLAADFWPLPFLAGSGERYSYAYSISADGQMIAGECNSHLVTLHGEGTQWRRSGATWVVHGLGLPIPPLGALNSPAQAIARDRTVTVGRVSFGAPTGPAIDTKAYCVCAKVLTLLPLPPGDIIAQANGATEAGSVIAGFGTQTLGYSQARPIVWLGSCTSGWKVALLNSSEGMANAVDNSGHKIVGWLRPPSAPPSVPAGSAHKGMVWTRSGAGFLSHWLMPLPDDLDRGEALGISPAGDFVVGLSGSSSGLYRPVYWRLAITGQPTSVYNLGMLPGYSWGRATAVSAGGQRIVGFCTRLVSGNYEYEAFVWEPAKGMRSLRNILAKAGVSNFKGWKYLAAMSISDDGKTVCGYGNDPKARDHAWAAVLP